MDIESIIKWISGCVAVPLIILALVLPIKGCTVDMAKVQTQRVQAACGDGQQSTNGCALAVAYAHESDTNQ